MSHHIYRNTSHTGSEVEVVIGWDRIAKRLYCIVTPLSDTTTGRALYDLDRDGQAAPVSLGYVTSVLLTRFSVVLPPTLLTNLMLDVLRGTKSPVRTY